MIVGDVTSDHGIGTDDDVISDSDTTHQNGAGPYVHVPPYRGHLVQSSGIRCTDRDLMENGRVFSYLRALADHQSRAVAKE